MVLSDSTKLDIKNAVCCMRITESEICIRELSCKIENSIVLSSRCYSNDSIVLPIILENRSNSCCEISEASISCLQYHNISDLVDREDIKRTISNKSVYPETVISTPTFTPSLVQPKTVPQLPINEEDIENSQQKINITINIINLPILRYDTFSPNRTLNNNSFEIIYNQSSVDNNIDISYPLNLNTPPHIIQVSDHKQISIFTEEKSISHVIENHNSITIPELVLPSPHTTISQPILNIQPLIYNSQPIGYETVHHILDIPIFKENRLHPEMDLYRNENYIDLKNGDLIKQTELNEIIPKLLPPYTNERPSISTPKIEVQNEIDAENNVFKDLNILPNFVNSPLTVEEQIQPLYTKEKEPILINQNENDIYKPNPIFNSNVNNINQRDSSTPSVIMENKSPSYYTTISTITSSTPKFKPITFNPDESLGFSLRKPKVPLSSGSNQFHLFPNLHRESNPPEYIG